MIKKWHDGANILLGAWLFVSPWVMQYTAHEAATWNAYLIGIAIVAFAVMAVYMLKIWKELFIMVFGVWLVISPYALGFISQTSVAMNAVIVGALSAGFATWAMLSDTEFNRWWHEHHFF